MGRTRNAARARAEHARAVQVSGQLATRSGLDVKEVRRLCAAFERLREPKLTAAQFGQPSGTVADWVGHWSVERGDPHPEQPNNRQEFERHLRGCQVCQQIEAARTHHEEG